MKIFGIDPGLSGAIAILEKKKVLNLFDMPVMAEGKKNKKQLNNAQLVNIIRENSIGDEEIAVVVEQVNAMPGQGVTSMFNFGQTFGSIKGICAALNLPIFFVRPSKWKKYFDSIQNDQIDQSHKQIISKYKNKKLETKKVSLVTEISNSSDVQNLINAYRRRGHQVAKIDPLHLREEPKIPDLELEFHGLSLNDLEREFSISNFQNSKKLKLSEILKSIKETYTSSIGYEFMHIMNSKIRTWFLEKIEGRSTPYDFNNAEKQHILKRLVDSEGLEKFLASKYPGAKRFGLEGGESLVPLLDTIIEDFGSKGAKELVLGMSHRGRLNVLINVMGKKPSELFTEFAEDFEEDVEHTGDVKYHLGFSSNILTSGGEVHRGRAASKATETV